MQKASPQNLKHDFDFTFSRFYALLRQDFLTRLKMKTTQEVAQCELIEEARGGSTSAFEKLMERHGYALLGVARSMMRDTEVAKELLHRAWIKAWQHLSGFQGKTSTVFEHWVRRILMNLCKDTLRAQKCALNMEWFDGSSNTNFEWQHQLYHLPEAAPNITRREFASELLPALKQLTEPHRVVINLHYFEGKTYAQIAERVGCPIGTVMSRLSYARRRLKKVLGNGSH